MDVGTNTQLLLIAEPLSDGGCTVVCDEARITRLGEGLKPGGDFLAVAMDRTAAVLKEFGEICRQHNAEKIAAVGTAAFRKVRDPKPFVERVRRESGITIEVISGEKEAELSYLSVSRDFGRTYPNLIALDIGGGSTEIIRGPKQGSSLPLGTVALLEKHIRHDPPLPKELGATRDEIHSILKQIRLKCEGGPASESLVGLAGTCTTLSAVDQGLPHFDAAKIQGSVITLQRLQVMIRRFVSLTVAERKELPGMEPERADTILPGAILLEEIMKAVGVDRVVISDRGVRYGLFYEVFC